MKSSLNSLQNEPKWNAIDSSGAEEHPTSSTCGRDASSGLSASTHNLSTKNGLYGQKFGDVIYSLMINFYEVVMKIRYISMKLISMNNINKKGILI